MRKAGGGDHYVEMAKLLDRARERRLDLLFVAGVDLLEEPLASQSADLAGDLLGLFDGEVGDKDVGAFLREADRGSPPNATRPAGYQCVFVFKPQSHRVIPPQRFAR